MPIDSPDRLVRLVFEHDADGIRLVAQLPVEGASAGLDTSLAPAGGHYVEVRGSQDAVLGRVAVPHAFASTVEVFPEQPGDPILRVPAGAAGTFTAVVSVPTAAERVAVVRLAVDTAASAAQTSPGLVAAVPVAPVTTELASFDLTAPEGQPS